ncbi:deoxyribonuclease IV [Desulforhabdus amnigena]|jgi:deoxyribonuclease-4|uniref:Probable endonuclease 4 n=1 Tax=Desulforhabdus amnigena TaxID=40218 RepID=A0A9W6D316_9BACT|nr:deoxyribonuclease IV [Desulforhabdus amnigena]NLJ28654.1 deoxyribonuclease IV [Deltaproteobacteria bacterium]GLI33297.1 putative endonuclease 4 [Desulforhabdus amnigena]
MPLLGAHMSIAGGLHLAFDRIKEVGGEALQIFTKNERQWHALPIEPEAVELFRDRHKESGFMPIAAHDTYLINLASAEPEKLEKSINAFVDELQRASLLGIQHLIMHPGSHVGQGVEEGLKRFVRNLDRAIALSDVSDVMILIETTAGQGTNLGSTFEEIATILHISRFKAHLGVCYDTCHTFAAGYDIRIPESFQKTFSLFDKTIGLEHLKFFHLNDSKKGLGSNVDRHEHIGKGEVGLEGFRLLLNDPRFKGHPMVLETPKGKNMKEDKENLRILRSLIQK